MVGHLQSRGGGKKIEGLRVHLVAVRAFTIVGEKKRREERDTTTTNVWKSA